MNMKYNKPEVVEVGSAVDAIQSNLTKGPILGDAQNQGDFTTSAAYESDE
jgi:hypothetical protein